MRTDPPLLLPFACGELAPAVRRALRYAGLPCVDVEQCAPADRQQMRFILTDREGSVADETPLDGVSRSRKQLSHSGRSRVIDVQSLIKVETPLTADYQTMTQTVDVANVRRRANGKSDVSRCAYAEFTLSEAESLLTELKSAVEKQRGIWARVGDFPYPYRAAICEGTHDELAQLAETLGHPTTRLTGLDEIHEHEHLLRVYLAGGLILRPREFSRHTDDSPGFSSEDAGDGEQMPLLWRTNCRDFTRWWSIRHQLQFSMARHPQGFALRCLGESKPWRPAIEVWKQNHMATLPWVAHDYLWKSGQHVWVQERHKHPAGLFCLAKLMEQAHSSRYEVALKQSA
ncbi:MAG: hypothetical protein WD065_07435 [Planctomycetaceae bacterium]